MTYKYDMQAGDVHCIDTHMFGFKQFNACYLIKAQEIALIDTGPPKSTYAVREAINKQGVAIEDIDHFFITHCEHPDHSGNLGIFLQENTKAKVYIHPIGQEYLTKPEIEAAARKAVLSPEMAARFGEMVQVKEDRIVLLQDGDVISLGSDRTLRAIFASGHQPSGVVFYDETNCAMFIHDLVGMYLADADFAMVLTPSRSDVNKYMESLHKLKDLPIKTLFMGHFGISHKPKEVIERALGNMQSIMDMGAECMERGKPEEIAPEFANYIAPHLNKLRAARGEKLYAYVKNELIASSCSIAFSMYYQSLKV